LKSDAAVVGRIPPFVIGALWFGVALLVTVGVLASIGRGVFPGDFAARADPVRQQLFEFLHREDPHAARRPEEIEHFDSRFDADPLLTVLHVLPGGIFLVLAPLQFSSRVRNRHLRFHRWSGRILIVAAFAFAIAGLYFGLLMPYGGLWEAAATILFGGLFLVFLGRAYFAIRRRQVDRHREWMIRAFSIAIGISTVRIVGSAFDVLLTPAGLHPNEVFALSLWTGWAITLAAAELWIRYSRPRIGTLTAPLTSA
jgi:uncharacterized membrane protein